MTSAEIQQKPAANLSTDGWLREACLQLALLNEKGVVVPIVLPVAPPEPVKPAYSRKGGR